MSEPYSSEPTSDNRGSSDMASALFAQLILQQTNMAMMLLGKIAHPESGQVYKDVEAARLFIDQLEMLESKTKGNLTKEESGLLKQSLMNLRLAFVEAVDSAQGETPAQSAAQSAAASAAAKPTDSSAEAPASVAEDEHRKKFSKKY